MSSERRQGYPTTNPFLNIPTPENQINVRFMNTALDPEDGVQEIWDKRFELKLETTFCNLQDEALRLVNEYQSGNHPDMKREVSTKVTIFWVMETPDKYFFQAEIVGGHEGERMVGTLRNRLKDGRDYLLVNYERALPEIQE